MVFISENLAITAVVSHDGHVPGKSTGDMSQLHFCVCLEVAILRVTDIHATLPTYMTPRVYSL